MGRSGNETTHFQDGLTVRGGLEADRFVIGPNAHPMLHAQMPQYGQVVSVAAPGVYGNQTGAGVANTMYGCRMVCTRDGLLTDMAVFISTASGNLDMGIYDCAATTWTKLFTTGSTASATTGWVTSAPNIPVFKGQVLNFCMAADNGTLARPSFNTGANSPWNFPTGWATPWTDAAATTQGTTTGLLVFTQATQFPLPNQLTVASLGSASAPVIAFLGRIQ